MKKFLSVILALAMVACVVAGFAGCSKSGKDENTASSKPEVIQLLKQSQTLIKLRDSNKLVIGITDYEPIDYQDKDGKWIGFDADLSRAVAQKMGIDVEFVVINWDNKFIELNSVQLTVFGTDDCIRFS